MDLRQFRNMLAIIEHGSISKAADALNISQPALTKSIRRLEEMLDAPLFIRKPRGMVPTLYAESLKSYAHTACNGLNQATATVNAIRNGLEGIISVAAPETIASRLFPDVVDILSKRRPNLQIKIFSQSEFLFSALLDGQYDLVVSPFYREIRHTGLVKRLLFDDRLTIVMRPNHPLARKRKLNEKQLKNCSWVVSGQNTVHRRRVERLFTDSGLEPPYAAVESRSPAVLKEIIMRTDYVGLLSAMEVESEVGRGLLRSINLTSPLMARPIGLLWREGYVFSPALSSFIEILEIACRRRGYIRKPLSSIHEPRSRVRG